MTKLHFSYQAALEAELEPLKAELARLRASSVEDEIARAQVQVEDAERAVRALRVERGELLQAFLDG